VVESAWWSTRVLCEAPTCSSARSRSSAEAATATCPAPNGRKENNTDTAIWVVVNTMGISYVLA
jgi:hypothetical protein